MRRKKSNLSIVMKLLCYEIYETNLKKRKNLKIRVVSRKKYIIQREGDFY